MRLLHKMLRGLCARPQGREPRQAGTPGPGEEASDERNVWHYPIVAGTWFKIGLSHEQVAAWHVSRLEDAFGALFIAAGSGLGAAALCAARGGGGGGCFFHSS